MTKLPNTYIAFLESSAPYKLNRAVYLFEFLGSKTRSYVRLKILGRYLPTPFQISLRDTSYDLPIYSQAALDNFEI